LFPDDLLEALPQDEVGAVVGRAATAHAGSPIGRMLAASVIRQPVDEFAVIKGERRRLATS
jgi:hypothetical protein